MWNCFQSKTETSLDEVDVISAFSASFCVGVWVRVCVRGRSGWAVITIVAF